MEKDVWRGVFRIIFVILRLVRTNKIHQYERTFSGWKSRVEQTGVGGLVYDGGDDGGRAGSNAVEESVR